jgi:1-acyl-sn-glycerol-3-phosphate acyltransferase
MEAIKRHRMVFKIIPAVKVFLKYRFNYTFDSLKDIDGPYLLLANHNLELDPAIVGVAAGKHLYFVASEHIMRKGIGTWILMTFFKPIIHQKGKQGMNTIKEMLKTLKDGHSVCIFPEGNRSFNGLTVEILPSIGKVARVSGAKLVTFRVEGGYLSQPRWSTTLRKGKMHGRLVKIYSVEELKEMSDKQINQAICTDLYEDAYATQKREKIAFKGKNLALGMESTVFACPKCNRIGTLHTDTDHLYCDCGFKAKYDVYGDLTTEDGEIFTVTGLDQLQKDELEKKVLSSDGEQKLFEDDVTVYEINNDHTLSNTYVSKLSAYRDHLKIGEEIIPFSEIQGLAIVSRNNMIMHVKGKDGHIEIKSDISFSALKYLYLYEMKGQVQ